MKRLDLLAAGSGGVIESLRGGESFLGRITAMGFTPETEVQVLRNGKRGPLLVGVRDTEVALGRGEAAKVYVREVLT